MKKLPLDEFRLLTQKHTLSTCSELKPSLAACLPASAHLAGRYHCSPPAGWHAAALPFDQLQQLFWLVGIHVSPVVKYVDCLPDSSANEVFISKAVVYIFMLPSFMCAPFHALSHPPAQGNPCYSLLRTSSDGSFLFFLRQNSLWPLVRSAVFIVWNK